VIFVGSTRARLEAWRAGDERVVDACFAATPTLLSAHGYGPKETEDAEYAAQQYAGMASLLLGPRRWVAAAEVGAVADTGSPYGQVQVASLRWRDVRAIFTDEPEALDDLARLAATVAGRTLAEVLADAAVLDAADEHDLLWYTPDELDRVD
jgi:hypothetical protein